MTLTLWTRLSLKDYTNMSDSLVYKELSSLNLSDDVISQFDCGNDDMSDYLHSAAKQDATSGQGVTYALVRASDAEQGDVKRIYAYATLKAHSLNYFEDGEKYHTNEVDDTGRILMSIPCVEIKMFAIDRALKGQIAYNIDSNHHYSSIFFKMLLEELYFMAMNVIGFQLIFLRANDEGENLYRSLGFVDCTEFQVTYDALAEGCKPLFLSLSNLEYVLYS